MIGGHTRGRRATVPLFLALSGVIALTAIAPEVHAQDAAAAAEALFQQGKSLKEQQRWAEACPKFEASYKLDKTLGTLMNLADCEEHVGKIASAWAHWGEAVELAGKAGDKRQEFAAKRRDALAKRLPMIRVDVPAGKSSLEVYRDGIRIDPAAYGVPLPSDPGPHVIAVRRGAETLAERKVVASEAQIAEVSLDLAAIEKAAPPPAAPPVTPVGPIAPAGPSGQRTAGFALVGVGAGAVVVAGVLEILAITSKSAANQPDACVNGYCTPVGLDAVNRARTFANAGQWVGIGGLLVAAVGVTLVLTSPSNRPQAPRAGSISLGSFLAPGGGGLSVQGSLR
jgi:hypothetical protein